MTRRVSLEDIEYIARSLNDDWAAGSHGAKWDRLDEFEREHWRSMARVHLGISGEVKAAPRGGDGPLAAYLPEVDSL